MPSGDDIQVMGFGPDAFKKNQVMGLGPAFKKTIQCGSCGSCRFWSVFPAGSTSIGSRPCDGECRKSAPVLVGTETMFPETKETDWCGEYQEREDS